MSFLFHSASAFLIISGCTLHAQSGPTASEPAKTFRPQVQSGDAPVSATLVNPQVPAKPVVPMANGQPIRYPVIPTSPAPQLTQQKTVPAPPNFNPSSFYPVANNGRSEVVNGGSSSEVNNSAGVSNALDISGSAGIQGSEVMKFVNGCTTSPGKFQTFYGEVGKKGCDPKLKMSETLANFLDLNLNRCVKQAAGISTSIESGKIYHAGVLGDAKHQKTGSLHNLGLAIDIKGIDVGGTVYDYSKKDATNEAFFTKFRTCWGEAANSERLGCLTSNGRGKPPGTIGQEDAKHTQHLHLSVPLCPQVAQARGLYIAIMNLLLGSKAHADDGASPSPAIGPKSKFKTKTLSLGKAGEARLKIEDTGGEPVDADTLLSLEMKCMGEIKSKLIEWNLPSCEFSDIKFSEATRTITLYYKTSALIEGELACVKAQKKKYPVDCGRK